MLSRKKLISSKLYEVIIISFYNIALLFYQFIGQSFTILLGIGMFIWFILRKRDNWNISQKLTFLSCIYIPTSFISVLGTSYGSFPLTWYHVVLILLYIAILFRGFKIGFYFFSPIIMFLLGCYSLFISVSVGDTIKQLLTISFFLISFFIGEQLSKDVNEGFVKKLKFYYLVSVFSFAIVIIIQRIVAELSGLRVGYYSVIGQNRIVSAGLMNDYSFATLYIATGAMMLIIDYIGNKSIRTVPFLLSQTFLFISMLLANSRTGLFALVSTMLLYLGLKIIQGKKKAFLILVSLVIIAPYVISYVVASRGGQSITEGSGRINLLHLAIEKFYENPFFGVGLGISNWSTLTGYVLPHNLIAQYLAQLGIIGSLVFYSNFIVFINKYFKFRSEFLWVIITVLIGAMVIPDIVSSRYLGILVIMAIVSSINIKRNLEEEPNAKSREITSKQYKSS
ncbi:O-antigen ligase family protein [Priestia megaterium]|uniref:O-antigen ligase family protein n=1 Tax=Priestia megaterium TaxID=1404 RepID=UPI002B24A7CD|nr:O-antigen ligase family protein [Priestia megaterium]MEB2265694.1 O-antigen ligase family protein [Priestia megaterium]